MDGDDSLVQVGSFSDPLEAELARSALESAGIETLLQADNAGGMRPHLAFGTGGYRILVRGEDVEAARAVLSPGIDVATP